MSPVMYPYKAFISYSHAADGQLAPTLQSALHRFAKPWYRLRAIRVFRDRTNLSANPGLWPVLLEALGQSEYLLLMASPSSAGSKWVRQEVEYWLANRDPQKLLILWTDGEIAWDIAAGDFHWEKTTALPGAVRGKFPQEPLYVDLRFAKSSAQLSTRHPEFLDRVATLAATLHGRPKDEIHGEEVRQHQRTKRLAVSAVVVLAMLALAAGSFGLLSHLRGNALVRTNRTITEQRDEILDKNQKLTSALTAEQRERRSATARAYVATAQLLRADEPEVSLLSALHARQVFEGTDQQTPFYTHAAIFNSLEGVRGLGLGREDGTVQVIRIDGERIHTVSVVSDVFRVRDISTAALETQFELPLPRITSPSLSRRPRVCSYSTDKRWVAVLGNSQQQELAIVDLQRRIAQSVPYQLPERSEENSDLNPPSAPVFGADFQSLHFVDRACHLHSFRLKDHQWHHHRSVDLFSESAPNPQLRFTPHCFVASRHFAYIASTKKSVEVRVLDLEDLSRPPQVLVRSDDADPSRRLTYLASAGRTLFAWGFSGGVPFRVWQLPEAGDQKFIQHPTAVPPKRGESDLSYSRLIGLSPSGESAVWQAFTGETFLYSTVRGWSGGLPRFLGRAWISADNRHLVAVERQQPPGRGSSVKIWSLQDIADLGRPRELLVHEGTVFNVSMSSDCRYLAVDTVDKSRVYESWVVSVDGDGNVTRRDRIPFRVQHHSDDFRFVSDDNHFWDRGAAASLQFPATTKVDREQGTDFHVLPANRLLYIDKSKRCVVGESLPDGTTRTISVLCDGVTSAAVNSRGTHAVILRGGECWFWSLTGTPSALSRVPLSSNAKPFYARVDDSGNRALVAAESSSLAGKQYTIHVLDERNPTKAIELESVNDYMSLRFEWLREGVAMVSSARTPAAAKGVVFDAAGQPIVEVTRTYSINGSVAERRQTIDIGGQWVARASNGSHICILSASAELASSRELGRVYAVSETGELIDPMPIVKEKGQQRIEDVSISSGGEWVGVAGNSPALYHKSDGRYTPTFLEVDGDRLDELIFDTSGKWAISFSSNNWKSWVSLWYLAGGAPNSEKIRVRTLEGLNVAGRQMNRKFGQRHLSSSTNGVTVVVRDETFRIPLDFEEWYSTASRLLGRELSDKEIRQHFGGRSVESLRPNWRRPLSVEKWEGTH